MSKSLGNVIDPFEALMRWPADVLRYYLLREIQSTEDGSFSWKNLETRYATDLANGLGNLVQRTATLIAGKPGGAVGQEPISWDDAEYHRAFEHFRLHDAAAYVWEKIGVANAYLNEREPWKQEGEERQKTLATTAAMIRHIAKLLIPFMPATAERIEAVFSADRIEPPRELLFPRRT
jgi:methionyl-tRNA synthetase